MAQKQQLEKLAHEDPEYYYHILSYAYALDVTRQRARQFEGITLKKPEWLVGQKVFDAKV